MSATQSDTTVPGVEMELHETENSGVVIGDQHKRLGEKSHLANLGYFRKTGDLLHPKCSFTSRRKPARSRTWWTESRNTAKSGKNLAK